MNKSSLLRIVSLASALAIGLTASVANAQVVRLHGGVGLAKALDAKKAAVEGQAGVKIEVIGNGSGRGLIDLLNGQADIAMVAGSLEGVAADVNQDKPGAVSTAGLVTVPLSASDAVFCVHPSVGIKSITDAQLAGILTGKITNWKDVGGADVPVKVVLPARGDGVRVTFQTQLLKGAPYVGNAIVRNSSKDVCVVVAQIPGACTIVGKYNVAGNVVSVTTESHFPVTWAFVTKGEAAGDAKKVIDAAAAQLKS